ncbi:hypothetical protein IJH89_01020 [Candidatus Saccharibacteria bacterium]|nr:hypothetical protein [Candidatus Saccharibacteria bacterium]
MPSAFALSLAPHWLHVSCYNILMVCIAAFIILGLIGIFVAVISIFKREVGRAYLKIMKKSWGCVGKKVRLQKCDTNFKDDVKTTLLKHVLLKHPKLVHPLSVIIEIASVIFVAVFLWAVVTSVKSLFSIWALGTCNVDQPAACTLSSEACSLGDDSASKSLGEKFVRWFTEWGDIFAAVPDRVKSWRAEEYFLSPTTFVDPSLLDASKSPLEEDEPFALDIVDPGCSACMMSFRNQLSSGFFESHQTALLVYPIKLDDGTYKFKNSGLFARYFYATALLDEGETPENKTHYGLKLLNRIFTEKTDDGIIFQSYFDSLDEAEAKKELKSWLKDFGASDEDLKEISRLEKSDEVKALLSEVENIVKNRVHIKGIPTLVYDNRKHLGLYETN